MHRPHSRTGDIEGTRREGEGAGVQKGKDEVSRQCGGAGVNVGEYRVGMWSVEEEIRISERTTPFVGEV
jgi:hypothetical protein